MGRKSRARDIVLYVLIALCVISGVALYAIYASEHGLAPGLPAGWIALVLLTILMCAGFIGDRRRSLGQPRMILAVAGLLVLHLLIWIPVVLALGNQALMPMFVGMILEYAIFAAFIERVARSVEKTPPRSMQQHL